MTDSHAATELTLYIENTAALNGPKSQGESIRANLGRKVLRGTYDPSKAPTLWLHLVNSGAQAYAREFGGVWHEIFPADVRRVVAEAFASGWESEKRIELANMVREAFDLNNAAHEAHTANPSAANRRALARASKLAVQASNLLAGFNAVVAQ